MILSKFEPQQFFRRPEAVAALVGSGELFGLMKRTFDLPSQWAALVRKSTGESVAIPAGGEVSASDSEEVLFVRTTPLDLRFKEEGISTGDGFVCVAQVSLRLSLIPERSELESFHKSVLGSYRLATTANLARYFQPAIRAALSGFAVERDAESLIEAGSAEAATQVITEAAERLCFSAGMALEGSLSVRFESDAYRKVVDARQEAVRKSGEHAAARELQEALERSQGEHLDHVASLLGRLKEMAAESPDVVLPELVRTFSEKQRGELYEALFRNEAKLAETQWVIVAAGNQLLFFDPTDFESPARRITIDGPAGPIRSIQSAVTGEGRAVLLLGGATGVYRIPPDASQPDAVFTAEGGAEVRGGFNAAVIVGDTLLASHSELGVHRWSLDEPNASQPVLEEVTKGARTIRNVCAVGDDVFCAVDDRVVRFEVDKPDHSPVIYTGSSATITALCPVRDRLFVGNSDGEVLGFSRGEPTRPERLHAGSGRPVESLWITSAQGVERVVFTDTSRYVHARVLGDSFAARYEAGGQTIRRVEVADDLLAGTNELRDRLLCWRPGEPSRPMANVSIAGLTQHSIQDVCLVPVSTTGT